MTTAADPGGCSPTSLERRIDAAQLEILESKRRYLVSCDRCLGNRRGRNPLAARHRTLKPRRVAPTLQGFGFTMKRDAAVRPNTSGSYMASMRVGGMTKVPAVVARAR
jgi:hypothetical protein